MKEKVIDDFQEIIGGSPSYLTHSPGRVNLIGEHTDYNDGFVLPMAINYGTWVALRPRTDRQVIVSAIDKNDSFTFDLGDITRGKRRWKEYVSGVAWALNDAGYELTGWEGVFSGNVPIGAGLSSSAALELAIARAFALVSDLPWDLEKMSLICQKAENQWVGINSGIMDQMISAGGKKDYAMMIDCRSLDTKQVPLPANTQIVILDTATRRGLVDSEYNDRRAQCEAVACYFDIKALRDLSLEKLEEKYGDLNMDLYHRARHVVSANWRVLEAVKALENSDPESIGELMNQSHASMRDDFEISRTEMDQMVEIAQNQPGCYGARMTGGGFGGCAVALVADDYIDRFVYRVERTYQKETGLQSKIYLTEAAEGTSFEEL